MAQAVKSGCPEVEIALSAYPGGGGRLAFDASNANSRGIPLSVT